MLRWNTNKIDIPGWYWIKSSNTSIYPAEVTIYETHYGRIPMVWWKGGPLELSEKSGFKGWAGPIEKPV